MKFLQIISALVLAVITIVSIIGLFASHKVVVAESVVINASAATIFEQINLWSNFKNWSPWNELDLNMKTAIEGEDGTVGSVYKWEGNNKAGVGRLEKTLVEPNSRIEYDLYFIKPYKAENKGFMQIEPQGNAQQVTWGFATDAPFPKNVMMFFMKGYIADDFKKGLNKLKEISEKEQ